MFEESFSVFISFSKGGGGNLGPSVNRIYKDHHRFIRETDFELSADRTTLRDGSAGFRQDLKQNVHSGYV